MKPMDVIEVEGSSLAIRTGRGFFDHSMKELLVDRIRNQDICGKEAAEVLAHTGWHYEGRPLFVTASEIRRHRAVAAAWITPIRWTATREAALNLSFSTAEPWERKGLARLLCLRAILEIGEAAAGRDLGNEVIIQSFRRNKAALGLAHDLGFEHSPTRDFKVESLQRTYLTFAIRREKFSSLANTVRDVIEAE